MSEPLPPQPSRGWYPMPTDPGLERYWDGKSWTEKVRVQGGQGRLLTLISDRRMRKWFALFVIALLAIVVLVNLPKADKPIHESLIPDACSDLLSHDWYELNAREFAHDPDVSARKSNSYFLETFIEDSSKYSVTDQRFVDVLVALSIPLDEMSNSIQFEPAAAAATKTDLEFKKLADYCASVGVDGEAPVLSEATDNSSEVDSKEQARIPEGYTDNQEGIAYKLIPSESCPGTQFGCTTLEIFAYRDCSHGVKVYANFFDVNGQEVARTDADSEPLRAGQSTALILSTGLSTAATATPNQFICQ